jgi:CPA2 family monovalent cation:H+ antiporter-2
MMQYDAALYRRLEGKLSVFERPETKREVQALRHYPLVLLGYHRGGYEFVRTFRQMKKGYVVIDFDPEVIEDLEQQNINHLYGDVTDLELLDEIGVHRSELVVSTINDVATNRLVLGHLMRRNKDALFICHANNYEEAAQLYEKGAAYVLLPHFIGNEQISSFIRRNGTDKKAFDQYRQKHLISIGRIAAEG